jgi:rubrerythrin
VDSLQWDTLDVDGALAESAARAWDVSRGAFLAGSIASSAALLGLAAENADAKRQGSAKRDVAILNYALTLEYLQAAFYTEAERLKALQGRTAQAARRVGSVERAHVAAFQKVLGRKAVKRPSFDFQGVTEQPKAFLKTAVAFEDLAVAAYGGQAARLHAKSAIAAAVSIHSVEARHAAWMRYLFGVNPARTAFDKPRSAPEIKRIVSSTNFITASPATRGQQRPGFTG